MVRAALGDARYLVEFMDGTQLEFTAYELAVAKHVLGLPANEANVDIEVWRPYVVYRVRMGSAAFGLAEDKSYLDLRGFFVAPAEAHWSLFKPPEHVRQHDDETDEHYWEIERYLQMLCKNDSNALETLWSPLVMHSDPVADALRKGRRRFLSKRIYYSFIEYAFGQLHCLDRDIRLHGEYRFKHTPFICCGCCYR